MSPARPGAGPATFREFALVYLWLLGGVAVLANRGAFPPWARIESYRPVRGPDLRLVAAIGRVDFPDLAPLARLEGQPILVVGDSLVKNWPWPADVIMLPGSTPAQIHARADALLGDSVHRYRKVVLWCGTAHLAGAGSIADSVEALASLVHVAERCGDIVIVLGPMPYDGAQRARFAERCPQIASTLVPETLAPAETYVRELRQRLPDTAVYDLRAFRDVAAQPDQLHVLYEDGLHLTEAGFWALGDFLATRGVSLAALPTDAEAQRS